MTGAGHGTVRSWPPEFEGLLRRHCPLADPAGPIGPGDSLVLLGMASFDLLAMIVDIEDMFAVTVPDDMLTGDQFATAGSMWSHVSLLITGAGAADG